MNALRRSSRLVGSSDRVSAILLRFSARSNDLCRFHSTQPEGLQSASTDEESDGGRSSAADFDGRDYALPFSSAASTSQPLWSRAYREKADRVLSGVCETGGDREADDGKRRVARALLEAALMKPDDEDEEESVAAVKVEDQRSLSVGIIGAPNSGKSSLTNFMVGTKVSAVSRKTNTTTHEVLGVMTKGNTQIVMIHPTPFKVESTDLLQWRSFMPLYFIEGSQIPSSLSECYTSLLLPTGCPRASPRSYNFQFLLPVQIETLPKHAAHQSTLTSSKWLMIGHHGYPYKNDVKIRVESAWKYLDCYDILIVLFDVHRHLTAPDKRVTKLIKLMGEKKHPKQGRILCMNKVDIVEDKKDLLKVAKEFGDLPGYERYFMLSGLKGSGVKDLTQYLTEQAVRRPWEEEELSGMTEEMMKSISLEVVREKMLHHIHQEIPYVIEHRLMDWKELRDGSLRVEQHFITPKQSQRQILVGKNGSKIGRIGVEANEELRSIFKREVHLVLVVRVARARDT
ncbi:GTP-binding family protein isoform X1 [Wolffia australiana]